VDIGYRWAEGSELFRLRSPLTTVPAAILPWRFRNAHHRRIWPRQLTAASDQLVIADPEGLSFIVAPPLRGQRVRDTRREAVKKALLADCGATRLGIMSPSAIRLRGPWFPGG
jgi:hypothetical protein